MKEEVRVAFRLWRFAVTSMTVLVFIFLQFVFGASAALAGRPLTIDDVEPVEKGKVEFELGGLIDVASFRNKDFELDYPFALTLGLVERLEVSLGTSHLRRHLAEEKPPTGFTDIILATKYKFLEQGRVLPAFAFATGLKLPTASQAKGLGNNKTEFDLNLIATRTFEKFSLHSMVSWFYKNSFREDDTHVNPRNVVRGGLAAEVPILEKFSLVGEIYGQNQEERGQPNLWVANVGFRFSPWDFVVFDAALAKGFGRSGQPKLAGTVGLTYTFGLWAKPAEKKASGSSRPLN